MPNLSQRIRALREPTAIHADFMTDMFDDQGDVLTVKVRTPFRYRWRSTVARSLGYLAWAAAWIAVIVLWASILWSCAGRDTSRPVAGALSRQCQSPTVVYCDPSLDARACLAVQDSLDWWNVQLFSISRLHRAFFTYGGVRAAPNETPPPNVVYVGRVPNDKHLGPGVAMRAAFTKFHAYTDTMCRHDAIVVQVILSEDLADGSLAQMFQHEFGHVLGLPHSDAPGCLMNPSSGSDAAEHQKELCESEANLLRAIYGS